MRLQDRDGDLFQDIQDKGDGKLARRHVHELHWPGSEDPRAMQRRLSALHENEYIGWPTTVQYRTERILESIVFLDWRGILWLAEQRGIDIDPLIPKNNGENQKRVLAKELRSKGIRWWRKPNSKVSHDIKVTDFRLALERDIFQLAVKKSLAASAGAITENEYRLICEGIKRHDGYFDVDALSNAFDCQHPRDGKDQISAEEIQVANDRLEKLGVLSTPADGDGSKQLPPPPFVLDQTIPESVLSGYDEKLKYRVIGTDGKVREGEQGIVADSFFVIANESLRAMKKPCELRLSLEVDMGTHPVESRFGMRKAAPYGAYIKSPEYKKRYGSNAGRWLVVTTTHRRMKHLIKETKRAAGDHAPLFLFTNFKLLESGGKGEVINVLSSRIWWQTIGEDPISLLDL